MALLKQALLPDGFLEQVRQRLVNRFQQQIGVQGHFQRLSRLAQIGVLWQE